MQCWCGWRGLFVTAIKSINFEVDQGRESQIRNCPKTTFGGLQPAANATAIALSPALHAHNIQEIQKLLLQCLGDNNQLSAVSFANTQLSAMIYKTQLRAL
jgi:hypothetical protein